MVREGKNAEDWIDIKTIFFYEAIQDKRSKAKYFLVINLSR